MLFLVITSRNIEVTQNTAWYMLQKVRLLYSQTDIDEAVYRWNTKKKMSESERFAHMFDKSIGLVRKWSEIRVGLMAA